ncbi:NB-ARC domain-containing protein [Chloroflexota bacterium]
MVISSLVKIYCYTLIDGLERSLADNLFRNFEISQENFFSEDERQRAYKRIQEDIGGSFQNIIELDPEEIIQYLDLGDLIGLINRHASSAKNINSVDIANATKVINNYGALSIRKRVMHPVRPLEIDDFQNLKKTCIEIQKNAPSLFWSPLAINLRRITKGDVILEQTIPTFWAEETTITHNLPPAEFDETGFIGRRKERQGLNKFLRSDHRVITIVGEGGIGKTALALRVCNDLLEEDSNLFERIVWISLKTRYLTPEGIREIKNAIDSIGYLIQSITKIFSSEPNNDQMSLGWDGIIEQMKHTKILLVIDNLETLGDEIRDLALEIPSGSKLLLTSRVGLGEIEIKYELSGFIPKDAMALFRAIVNIHNIKTLSNISDDTVHGYVQLLQYNPLLIKWFAVAVGNGAEPDNLLKGPGMEKPLEFCVENIYEKLDVLERKVIAVIMSARRALTNAQLLELTNGDAVELVKATQKLARSSILKRVTLEDGPIAWQLGGLVYEYLKRTYPPNDNVVSNVRMKIKEWQTQKENVGIHSLVYRYAFRSLQITNQDELIAAQHLMRALTAINSNDLTTAEEAISKAEQLTPAWCEIYRFKAILLEHQKSPIYEIEEAYEQCLNCADNDVNRYHYAVYLNRIDENERAVEQLELAKKNSNAEPLVLDSILGLALSRLGRSEEALVLMLGVWNNRSDKTPAKYNRIHGTQLVEAYRRDIEQLQMKGLTTTVLEHVAFAMEIVNECLRLYGCDYKLVEVAVDIIYTAFKDIENNDKAKKQALSIIKNWEANEQFRKCLQLSSEIPQNFKRSPKLSKYFPYVSQWLLSREDLAEGRHSGTIQRIVNRKSLPYGFIDCQELGQVYFNQKSLASEDEWGFLSKGVSINFDIVAMEAPFAPIATRIKLGTSK